MDLGTGGGFPGIPLAILHSGTHFILVDSIRKKITAVQAVIRSLGLTNAEAVWARAEEIGGKFNGVVTRAVAPCPKLLDWVEDKTTHLLALKGGDLAEEIKAVGHRASVRTHRLSDYFEEDFFRTKVVLELQW
jgi:16S rRNA (guanine527-N7)-methyltransferase